MAEWRRGKKTVQYCAKNLPESIPSYLKGGEDFRKTLWFVRLWVWYVWLCLSDENARFGRAFIGYQRFILPILSVVRIWKENRQPIAHEVFEGILYLMNGPTNYCILLTIHNLINIRKLTKGVKDSTIEDTYPEFIKSFNVDSRMFLNG